MLPIKFRQINKYSKQDRMTFLKLVFKYLYELNNHDPKNVDSDEDIKEYTKEMINDQGKEDKYLEFCYVKDKIVGFLYGQINRKEIWGCVKPNNGYIMEFYILPQYRHKGYGKIMYRHLKHLFNKSGVKNVYLEADPVTGIPFWEALKFRFTGKHSNETGWRIYKKSIVVPITNS